MISFADGTFWLPHTCICCHLAVSTYDIPFNYSILTINGLYCITVQLRGSLFSYKLKIMF